ncbi:MAG TPA: uroporphyrinogen decarboxylase family protein [Oscillospiraceae bacterium]|nr:uroporphyrinogen decarboxylase family protein [Oscillospiraceae bacterium]HPF55137.1 uroporphyrinogen decarboxylase family protein [Clostridiales bacterium]HPK34545.1 uroporphyrinogen decarboxylase family protein [Oscillospiraceae bacterium]HPR74773.1 uroporphyrinogen decarboxylase family protein [Oscillospiraceae bacterium]
MTERENYLRTVEFGYPEYIPVTICMNLASLIAYQGEMEAVMARFPEFFPNFQPGKIDYAEYGDGCCDITEPDAWGYQWHYKMYGIEGCVINPPLDDWHKFNHWKAPDSDVWKDRGGQRDWAAEFQKIAAAKQSEKLTRGGLVHGFLFLRLQYLMGFENLMVNMAEEDPNLFKLIDIIDRENLKIVQNYCKAGVDVMELPEDLGAESSMIISKEMFRQYIAPSYRKLTAPCRQNKVKVAIHSDGYILPILDDLIEIGMDIINPQDLCNGIGNLAKALKGKVCIRLDLDRVKITSHGTRAEIFELIEEEVKVLGSEKGGLEFIYGVYPPTGPDQVAYICEAFQKYRQIK